MSNQQNWDFFFMAMANAYAAQSKCASVHLGAVIVKDGRYIVTGGYNGAPRHSTQCQDLDTCPRREMGYESGMGMEHCPAVHAEVNAILTAARIGVSVAGCTLYLNGRLPCKNCMGAIINAGIVEVVVVEDCEYDKYIKSKELARDANVRIRVLTNLDGVENNLSYDHYGHL
jgi:dCMP deaminase